MANSNNSVEYIETTSGLVKVYYPGLDALPVSDATLREKGMFADAKVVGDRLKPLEDALKDKSTQKITTSNVVDRVVNLEVKTADTENGHGKRITDIEKIINDNKLTSNTRIAERVTDLEKVVGKDATEVTDWNTATETGWYYNNDASKVKNGPLDNASGYYVYGEVIAGKHQIIYMKKTWIRIFIRCIVGGNDSWIELTMHDELTTVDFQNMMNNR